MERERHIMEASSLLPSPPLLPPRAAERASNTPTGSSTKIRNTACVCCRRSKRHCSRSLPCERCFRLFLVCRPQVPIPYNRGNGGGGEDGSKEARGSGQSDGGGGRKRRRGGDQRRKRDVEAALAMAVRVETDRSILLELIFDRLDPRPFATIFLEAVVESASRCRTQEGALQGVDRSWTMCFLRSWWIHSNLLGADTSWGMGKAVARLLKVSSFDMEDSEGTQLDFPAHIITMGLQFLQKRMVASAEELQQHPVFQGLLAQLSPATAVFVVGTTAEGLPVETNNEAFSLLFRGADRRFSSMMLHKTLPFILFLALVAPDDRREWSRFIIEACTQAPIEPGGDWRRVRIFKLVGAEGNIQLYLVEARPLPSLGAGGIALILEPCRPSRHVTQQRDPTPRAGQRAGEDIAAVSPSYAAVSRLEQVRKGGEGRDAGEGGVQEGEEGSSNVVLPGMAVVPIALPPTTHSWAHQPPAAAEQEALEAIFGRQEDSLSRLVFSPSGGRGNDDARFRKMLPTRRRTKKGNSADTKTPLLEEVKQPLVPPSHASTSSSMLSSTSTLSTASSSSSSSSSTSSSSSSSPSLSWVPPHLPLSHEQQQQQHPPAGRPLEPAHGGPTSPGARFGTSDWDCLPPVLNTDLLEAVFGEGEDAT